MVTSTPNSSNTGKAFQTKQGMPGDNNFIKALAQYFEGSAQGATSERTAQAIIQTMRLSGVPATAANLAQGFAAEVSRERQQEEEEKLEKKLKTATIDGIAQTQKEAAAQQPVYGIDRKSEQLSAHLDDLKLWSAEEKKYLESIDPNAKRDIVQFDDAGEPKKEKKQVTGQKLRDSITIIKAIGNEDKLDEKGKAILHKTLHGDKPVAKNIAELVTQKKEETKQVSDAIDLVVGDRAAQTTDVEQQKIFGEKAKQVKEAMNERDKLIEIKKALSEAPSQVLSQERIDQEIKDKEKEVKVRASGITDILKDDDERSARQTQQELQTPARAAPSFAVTNVNMTNIGSISPDTGIKSNGYNTGRSL